MGTRIRVLLVDDSEAFRTSAGRFLSGQSTCELVGVAASGEEALECLATTPTDLVLLDIAMPGGNGLDFARRMKSRSSPPRVVMVTIHDDASYRNAARETGAEGLIPKADFTEQVLALLQELTRAEGESRQSR